MAGVVEAHPTRHVETILRAVDCIYAAACGETSWQRMLAVLCELARLDGCALSTVDPPQRRRVLLASSGLRFGPEPTAPLCPLVGSPQSASELLRSAPGTIWQDRPVLSGALPPEASSWAEWMTSNGFASWTCVIIDKEGGKAVCLEIFTGAGRSSSSPPLADFLRQLAPHLTRAWRLRRTSLATCAAPLPAESPAPAPPDAPSLTDLAALPEAARLRAEFGLTKAEARLALRLADGTSLASAAQASNVKLTTVRSQLQQVFAKTGTARQTELVAMLLSRGYACSTPAWGSYKATRPEATVTG